MGAFRPELTTKQQVLHFYENSDIPNFKVFAGTKPDVNALRYEYDKGNMQEGFSILNDALDGLLANPMNINTYVLQLIRSERVLRPNTHKNAKGVPDAINITFQLNFAVSPYVPQQQQSAQLGAYEQGSSKLLEVMEKMVETQNAILSKLNAQLEDEDEDEDEELPLMGLLKDERVQNVLIDKIVGLFGNNKSVAMAGVPETDEQLKLVIERLQKLTPTLVNDLEKLASIGEKNKGLFDVLLSQLRSM